jgi:F0F1-type ATP synthase membrane subunit c/vacuolar-type H+-ATPase subunit K
MILNKFLTRKGWRVVAHSILAVAGIGLLYLLSRMIIGDIRQEDTLSWWILGVAMTASLWLVALGSMLAKAELTDWK